MRPPTNQTLATRVGHEHPIHAAAFEFAVHIYERTDSFPTQERFGIVGQLRRAATSIVANLAEGGARFGSRQLHYFASMAYGSARECEVLLRLSMRIGYLSESQGTESLGLLLPVSRQLLGLLRALRKVSEPRA